MRPFLTAVAAMIAACLLVACDAESPAEPVFLPAPPAPDSQEFLSPVGKWRVTSLRGEPVPEGVTPPSLTIEPDGTVSGYGAVNWYSGALDPGDWDHGVFDFGSGFWTMRLGRGKANEVEALYAGALSEARNFAVRSGALELGNDAGVVILRFEPATPEGRWRLASLRGETVPAGARTPTLTIDSDGLVSGFAGVNLYWTAVHPGAWSRRGFEFGRIRTTAIESSHEAMDAESRYLGALSEATRFAVRSSALELSNGAGVIILRFEPAAP